MRAPGAGLFSRRRRAPLALIYVDLVQDIDVLEPVIAALRADRGFRLKVAVSRWLKDESPRTLALLDAAGLDWTLVRRRAVIEGKAPSLRGVDLILCASESSHPAHAAGHALALRAAAAGVPMASLQHGLENVGLSGRDSVGFAAARVFCWFPPGAVPEGLSPATRARLVHTGRAAAAAPPARADAFDVGVFENLHAERYGPADRTAFLDGVVALAGSGASMLVRPHPAGGWGAALPEALAGFDNVTLMAPEAIRADREGVAGALARVRRVITTPSTIALDAASAGRPVWLAAPGGPAYVPLPLLRGRADWIAAARAPAHAGEAEAAFVARALVPGDAGPRILAALKTMIGQSTAADPLPSGASSD